MNTNILLKHSVLIILAFFCSVYSWAEDGSYIRLDKTADYDYNTNSGVITLSSYVTGEVKQIKKAVPADILLVLDYSSSMKDNSKNTMLQKAASDFIDTIAVSANNNNIEHRIGIIIFGTGAHVKSDYLSVKDNSSNVALLKGIVNSECPASGETSTRYDLAFWLASNMVYGGNTGSTVITTSGYEKYYDLGQNVNSNATTSDSYGTGNLNPYPKIKTASYSSTKDNWVGVRTDAAKFLVFLTDGEPTGNTLMGNFSQFTGMGSISTIDTPSGSDANRYGTNWTSSFMFGIPNFAIKVAKDLKENKDVKIYGIHIDPNDSNKNIHQFAEDCVRAISSEYPDAERYRTKYWGTKTTETIEYYQRIKSLDQATISGAFTNISSSIEKVVSVKYGVETIIKDYINNAYFKLPDGISSSDIDVKKVKCTGVASNGDRTFSTTEESVSGISVTVTPASDSADEKVTISGFDYSANWCGVDETNSAHGYELLVKIPFKLKDGINFSGSLQTNGPGSGVYPAKRDDSGNLLPGPQYDDEPAEPYPFPVVEYYKLKIVRNDLEKGECAVYKIEKDGNVIATISLNGTGEGAVSKEIARIPAGDYTVTEIGWNWSYTTSPDSKSITKTTSTTGDTVFEFSGAHTSGNGAVNKSNHSEDFIVNTIDVRSL